MKSTEFEDDPSSAEDEIKEADDKPEDLEMEANIIRTIKLQNEEDVTQLGGKNKNILCDNDKKDTKYLDNYRNNINNENNNNNTKHIVICESNIKHRLTFGIDSILKEDVKSSNDDTNHNKYTHTDLAKANQSDKTSKTDYTRALNGAYNTSDEEEIEADDFRLNPASFEAESTRARLALLRYSATIPAYGEFNGANCLRPGAAQHTVFQHSFSLTNTGSGFVWPSPTAAGVDGRKDRFGFVRRVGHPYQNRTPPKRKKPRTSFTRLQILELEKRFERQKYLASTERSALAKSLKMTDAQVKTWFQNRRTKWRRQTAEEREIERQAANRLLLSLQPEAVHRKSVVMSTDPVCLSHFQRWQDQRSADV